MDELRSTWSRKDVQYTMYLMLPVAMAALMGLLYSVEPIKDSLWEGDYDKFGDDKDADLEQGEVALWVEDTPWKVTIVVQDPEGTTIINRSTANVTESISASVDGRDLIYLKVGSFEVEEAGTYIIYANNSANLYITKNITQGGFFTFMCTGGLIGIGISAAAYFFLFKKRKRPVH